MARQRLSMTLIGALAGLSLYLLTWGIERGLIEGRLAYSVTLAAVSFFGGLLATSGPLPLRRAALGALVVSVATALLFSWAGLRFADVSDILTAPIPLASVMILSFVPWPFLIAEGRDGWRDYSTLFSEAWGIVMRVTVAGLFVGLVWGVIFLSDAVLGLVGVTMIADLLDFAVVPWVITGVVTGLALSVVLELSDYVTPYLVLRLLRLLVPVVLVVMVVFIAALPFKGLEGLFGGVSVAAALLAISAAAATLVTSAVDQDDLAATPSTWMQRATQALAALTIVPAVLAAWAIWLRVAAHGWTPDRLLSATVAALGLGYGAFYLVAVVRGSGWMERVRQGNTSMALVMMAAAVLWLTPVLNPEAIATRSQMARFSDGRTALGALDIDAFRRWGVAGQAGLVNLGQQAVAGNAELAARLTALDDGAEPAEIDERAVRAALLVQLPLQPDVPAARALRDTIFAQVSAADLTTWRNDCSTPLPQGGPGCVMVISDFLTKTAGDEAMLITRSADGYMTMEGFSVADGILQRHGLATYGGQMPQFAEGAALISDLQNVRPTVEPVPFNQILSSDGAGLAFAP